SGELFIPSRGERIRAHNQFMLFATRTLVPAPSLMSAQAAHDGRDIRIKGVKRSGGSTTTEAMLASNVWTKVELEPLGRAELVQVIREGRYAKNLGGAAEMLVSVYDRIRGHNGVARGSPAGRDSGRFVSTRDLLKWCRRIDVLITNHQNSNDLLMAGQSGRDLLALEIGRQWLFEEAADVFCGMEPGYDAWICMLRAIGVSALGIPEQRVLHYAQKEMPEFERSTSSAIIKIGRCILRRRPRAAHEATVGNERPFAETRHSRKLMEKIAVSVSLNEPLLLVGETGTGKTTVVQRLADIMGEKLVVINLSQQSDSSDLLGGFKPVDIRMLLVPIKDEFEELFAATFSTKSNAAYLDAVRGAFGKRNWKRTVRLFKEACGRAEKVIAKYRKSAQESDAGDRMGSSFDAVGRKRREDGLPFAAATAEAGASKKKKKVAATSGRLRMDPSELERRWSGLRSQVTALESQLFAPGGGQQQAASHSMAFSFVVGALVHAVKRGYWVLLDEINLATPETLESLSGLLQSPTGSLMLTERGDIRPLPRHPGFRVFACMNPATDVGKRDLPPGLRNRFTEFYVHSPDSTGNESDLLAVVECYLNQFVRTSPTLSNRVVEFYRLAKHLASRHSIVDGAGQRPHYSLRTLSRALTFARDNAAVYSIHRALYDGLYMTFVTQLDRDCQSVLDAKLREVLFQEQSNVQALLDKAPAQPPPRPTTSPAHADNPPFVRYGGFWLATGPLAINPEDTCHYVITSSVERQLSALARAVMCGKYPVLIQGPTSAGKTSMVEYLARETGHKFVRINNHEHTDLQEYVGSYVSRDDGRLEFKEGLLVTALREGHWIVLDELNLAPTDVLEALNRLLDDNRELLIPETQETVRPHPHFRLFATQNPAGLYGGRKALSRAFRNRFLEFHFSELPMDELETILITRCQIAPSYAKKLVAVYRRLTDERQQSRMFEARHGFITLRDLFRWAMRGDVGYQQLAESGYMLLAERVRKKEEKLVVKRVLEETMKVKLDEDDLYSVARLEAMPEYQEYARLHCREVDGRGSVPLLAWTRAMRRLFMLTSLCLRFHEPVLLVGETGCGKTTVCQVLAMVKGRELKMVNCHQNTETSDLLGGQRPVRDRVRLVGEARDGLAGLIRAALEECSNSNVSETAVDVEGLAGMTLPELQDLWARLLEAPDTGDAIR
ncbi:AAA ATPase midasin, partial [Spiromyces aspiralis]